MVKEIRPTHLYSLIVLDFFHKARTEELIRIISCKRSDVSLSKSLRGSLNDNGS